MPGVGRSTQLIDGRFIFSGCQQFPLSLDAARLSPEDQVQDARGVKTAYMCRGARPWIFDRSGHNSGAHRIHLHIAKRGPNVAIIERAGVKTVLPKMSAAKPPCVQVLRIG